MKRDEVDLAARLVTVDLDLRLSHHVMRRGHAAEKALSITDESVGISGIWSAVYIRVIVKSAAMQFRHQPVLPPHVIADRLVDIAPGAQVAKLRLEVEL